MFSNYTLPQNQHPPTLSFSNRDIAMAKSAAGSVNDVTRFLSMEAGPSSPTTVFSASSQADWAAKRLVWVPSEKHGFEVRGDVG